MKRAGFLIHNSSEEGAANPKYKVVYSTEAMPITAFSKVYSKDGNPTEGFVALMCCGEADDACPVVEGASARFAIHYVDPKVSDDTEKEAATYDERCHQIATEMFYLMSLVKA